MVNFEINAEFTKRIKFCKVHLPFGTNVEAAHTHPEEGLQRPRLVWYTVNVGCYVVLSDIGPGINKTLYPPS